MLKLGFPGGSHSKNSACKIGDLCLILGSGRSSGEGNVYSLQSREFCGQKSLEGYSSWGCKDSDTAEWEHIRFSSVQSLSRVQFFVTPWTAACQASLSITNYRSLPKLMSIESAMPSNHLILCCPLLLLPSIFPSIRVFSNESALHIRWPNYWSFSFNICPFTLG